MKKSTKILISVLLSLVLIVSALIAVPYFAWSLNIFHLQGWHRMESGDYQYWNRWGTPQTQWQLIDERWYYFSPDDNNMYTGWLETQEGRYYLGKDGIRRVGWLYLEEGIYYLQPSDATAAIGWLTLDDRTYYMDETGAMYTGWLELEGNTYYLSGAGTLVTGWQEIDGNRYYLGEDGIMVTGWVETEKGRCYLGEDGILCTGWTDTDEGRYYLTEDGCIATGWTETEDGTYYFDENGQITTGWLDTEEGRYYLDENGKMTTGWLEMDGTNYYFRENGIMAIGKVIIEEKAYYFTSTGAHVHLVNAWNPIPDDYTTDLVSYNNSKVDKSCYDSLAAMLKDLKSVGYFEITSAYRSKATQQVVWDRRVQRYMDAGYSKNNALAKTALEVAVPGTSEHHLGLAVDISAGTTVDNWLAENSWRYGFIVRYPEGKTDITGIIYEPWHFRYVGNELAKELYDLGLCLEEYMDMLTAKAGSDAGTASNPENATK